MIYDGKMDADDGHCQQVVQFAGNNPYHVSVSWSVMIMDQDDGHIFKETICLHPSILIKLLIYFVSNTVLQ